jgi:hypothetical protein
MTILCLCREEHHWKLIPGYSDAFRRRGVDFACVDETIPLDATLDEVVGRSGIKPSAIFHFESAHPLFPIGLEKSTVPTVCFHPDTYAFTERRIRWSMLFDHVVVFHPGYQEQFRKAGHPGALLLPHAVRREFFDGPELEREFELGWVGQISGPFYKARAEWLPKLAAQFRSNDWATSYTVREVAETYRRSKIVVNIGRDDFPQDANLRVFEVLASGALLLTSLPSELEQLGFIEGTHFVGYRRLEDISSLVGEYLSDATKRVHITDAARDLVLSEHTYDRRADQLMARLGVEAEAKQAPARSWPETHARLAAMDFYAAHGLARCATSQFRRIAGRGFRETIEASALLSRAWIRSSRAS